VAKRVSSFLNTPSPQPAALGAATRQEAGGAGREGGGEGVSVVIPCFRQAHFLDDAIRSVLRQDHPARDIVVVDDGSPDATAEVAARYPAVTYLRQPNRGLAAARNVGLRHSRGEYVVFLDADDRLLPQALGAGLVRMSEHPELAFVWGRYANIDAAGAPLPPAPAAVVRGDPYLALLRRNVVGMHATVMYRRADLEAAGGFDERLRACEDYDLYLRIASRRPVGQHGTVVAEYRRHGAGMSRDYLLMIAAGLRVLGAQEPALGTDRERWRAYRAGVRHVVAINTQRLARRTARALVSGDAHAALADLRGAVRQAPHWLRAVLRGSALAAVANT
jgi:glycosyltransferase involved in cell wall biosynthesis